jgi:hypothetical protein
MEAEVELLPPEILKLESRATETVDQFFAKFQPDDLKQRLQDQLNDLTERVLNQATAALEPAKGAVAQSIKTHSDSVQQGVETVKKGLDDLANATDDAAQKTHLQYVSLSGRIDSVQTTAEGLFDRAIDQIAAMRSGIEEYLSDALNGIENLVANPINKALADGDSALAASALKIGLSGQWATQAGALLAGAHGLTFESVSSAWISSGSTAGQVLTVAKEFGQQTTGLDSHISGLEKSVSATWDSVPSLESLKGQISGAFDSMKSDAQSSADGAASGQQDTSAELDEVKTQAESTSDGLSAPFNRETGELDASLADVNSAGEGMLSAHATLQETTTSSVTDLSTSTDAAKAQAQTCTDQAQAGIDASSAEVEGVKSQVELARVDVVSAEAIVDAEVVKHGGESMRSEASANEQSAGAADAAGAAGAADTGAADTAAADTGAADTGAADTAAADTGAADTGAADAGAAETGAADTGAADAGAADTGAADTGAADTGAADTGAADTGAADTGAADAGAADTGAADTGAADAGAADTGAADTGAADTGAANTGAANTGAADAGAADTGAADTGAADTGAADTGTADTGPADTGAADTGAADTGAANTGAADTGAANTGAANTGAANTGAADTGAADTGPGGVSVPDANTVADSGSQTIDDDMRSKVRGKGFAGEGVPALGDAGDALEAAGAGREKLAGSEGFARGDVDFGEDAHKATKDLATSGAQKNAESLDSERANPNLPGGNSKDTTGADGAIDTALVGSEDGGDENLRPIDDQDREPIDSSEGRQVSPSAKVPGGTPLESGGADPNQSAVQVDSTGEGPALGVQALQTNGTSAASGSAEVDGIDTETGDSPSTDGSGRTVESEADPEPENNASQPAKNDGVETKQAGAAAQVGDTDPSKRTENSAS